MTKHVNQDSENRSHRGAARERLLNSIAAALDISEVKTQDEPWELLRFDGRRDQQELCVRSLKLIAAVIYFQEQNYREAQKEQREYRRWYQGLSEVERKIAGKPERVKLQDERCASIDDVCRAIYQTDTARSGFGGHGSAVKQELEKLAELGILEEVGGYIDSGELVYNGFRVKERYVDSIVALLRERGILGASGKMKKQSEEP